jgi:hypothetical protein
LTRVVLAAVASAALACPAAALAQTTTSNPFNEALPTPSVSTTTTVPTISTSATAGSGSAFTGNSAIIIGICALVVLGGISLYIWRDARKRAPVRHRPGESPDGSGPRYGTKPRAKPRKLSPAERRRRKRGRAR